jgi:hypothetical protein
MDKVRTTLKGTWAYHAQRLINQGELIVGSKVSLQREPNNPHDRKAVAVFVGQNKVGYLPRTVANEYASYLDAGGKYHGEISHVGTRKYMGRTNPSVNVDLVFSDSDPPFGFAELIQAASLLAGIRGVYRIQNKIDKRAYIGSSTDVGKRLLVHITQLRNGTHTNYRMSEGWRRNGPAAFEVSLIERAIGEKLRERERFYIQTLGTHTNGYNQTADGEGANPLSASQRSRLGLDLLPAPPPAHTSQFHPSPPPIKSAQGCLVVILCFVGVAAICFGQAITSNATNGRLAACPQGAISATRCPKSITE